MASNRISYEDLKSLIAEGEHQHLEFKQSFSKKLKEEMVAFANSEGGVILVGVADNGDVTGVSPSRRELDKIQDMAYSCEPHIDVSSVMVDDILVIDIAESDYKPVVCRSGSYIRKDGTCRQMSAKDLRNMMADWNRPDFDTQLCKNFAYPEDFSETAYRKWKNLAFPELSETPEELLTKLDAACRTSEGLLFTNAAVLMFARRPGNFFTNSGIFFTLFNGTENVHVVKKHDIDAPMIEAVEEMLYVLRIYMLNAHEINVEKNGGARIEHPEYSAAAVREAMVNAIIHRDWLREGGTIMAEMFRGRLEIKSPGGLIGGVTTQNMSKRCERRNHLLADLFARAGYGEKAGTGVKKMIAFCREIGSSEPLFEADTWVNVTFYSSPLSSLKHIVDDPRF